VKISIYFGLGSRNRNKKACFLLLPFGLQKLQKTRHSVLNLKTVSGVVLLQLATITVDLLFCNANSISDRIATGYPLVYPLGVLSWETVALILQLGVRCL